MFMGEFNHSLDPKNRVFIPSKFRDGLSDNFVITAGLDGCLYLCPYADWESFVSKLAELPIKKETRELQRFFMQNAAEAVVDKQGRTIIPANLKSYAKIDKDVVFIGVLGKVELWAKEVLDNLHSDKAMEDIVETLSTEYGLRF